MIKIIIIIFLFNTLVYADERDITYNYIGTWEIISCFSIDGILVDYLNEKQAVEYIGKTIVYGNDFILFLNNIYIIKSIISEYYTSDDLRRVTRGSGTPGFNFFNLKIDDLICIRSVIFNNTASSFGGSIFVINNGQIIINHRGFFFRADRVGAEDLHEVSEK
jgi:hypothetical protein